MHDYFLPLLLDFFLYKLVDNKENDFQNRLKSIIMETFKNNSIRLDGILKSNTNKDEYLAIFKLLDCTSEALSRELISSCDQLIAAINNQLNCDIQCSIRASSPLDKIQSTVKELQVASREIIDFRNKIFYFETHQKNSNKYIEPNLQLLEHYLETGNRLSFNNKCYQ